MMSKRVILAGGTGFTGTMFASDLAARGYEMIVLSRSSPATRHSSLVTSHWDGRTLGPWADLLNGALAVVNLAGRSVNCHHNAENRREIVESRVDSVNLLGEAIRCCPQPPEVWVQAGGEGIYGCA